MFNLFKPKTDTADPYGIEPWPPAETAEYDPVTIELARRVRPTRTVRQDKPKRQPSYALHDPVYWAG